ncbi:MAG: hypothetical protein ACM3ZT_03725 [Bacillota bacterium]
MRKFTAAFLVAIVLFGCVTTAYGFGGAGGQALGAGRDGQGNSTTSGGDAASDLLTAYPIYFIGI